MNREGPRRIERGVLVVAIVAFCTGCVTETVTDAGRTVLTGRVYDENAAPVAGATITSGRFRGISDSSGRFRIDGMPHGTRRFIVSAESHEEIVTDIQLYSPGVYSRITLWSLPGLIDRAIHLLHAGATGEVQTIYRRSLSVAGDDERVRLLGEILGERE
ncbi:MAG: carboxypeptidase-like regulatory domain-containing protein [Alkalispirochaeta sp.]